MLDFSGRRKSIVQIIDNNRQPPREIRLYEDFFKKSDDVLLLIRTTLQDSQEIKRMNEESRSNLVEKRQNLRTEFDHQEMIRLAEEKRNLLDTMIQKLPTEDEQQECLESNWDYSIAELPEDEPLTVDAIITSILDQIQQLFTIVQECRIDLEEQIRTKDVTARMIDRNIASCQESLDQVEEGIRLSEDQARETCTKLISENEDKLRDLDSDIQRQVLMIIVEKKNNIVPAANGSSRTMTKAQKTIIKSNSIRACAFNMCQPFIQLLLDNLPLYNWSGVLDSLDSHGSRPARRSIQDHEAAVGLRSVPRYQTTYQTKDRLANELELVLMPARGPSPAYKSVDEENSSDDDDDDDDGDDDIEEEGEDDDQDVEEGDDDVEVDEEGEEF